MKTFFHRTTGQQHPLDILIVCRLAACSGWPPVPPDRPSLLAACPAWPPSVFVISLEGSLSQMAAQCKRMIVNITIFELPPFVTTCEVVHLMAARVKL